MDGTTLNITATWTGDLEEELLLLLRTEINPAVKVANDAVGESMRDVLAKHISKDVYSAYEPKVYERRGESGGLLGQAMNMGHGVGGIITDSSRAKIQFMPDGTHPTEGKWTGKHGDELIGRIEKHNPEYNWLPRKKSIPNRPFWQNFVDEMVDGGEMETVWARALKAVLPKGWKLSMKDGGVQRDPQDGEYG